MLGRSGTLSLTVNKHEKLVIRLASESWETILNNYAKYFNSIYGEKYIAFQKLSDIRRLTSNKLKIAPPCLWPSYNYLFDLCLATHIVYDISLDGVNRKLSLSDQLSLFSINSSTIKSIEIPAYTDNFTTPSILFIIGFINGDGSLHLRLRNSDKGSIWLIPTLLLPQLKNKYNAHFFSMLEKFFNSLNIKTYYINKTKDGFAKMLSLDIFSCVSADNLMPDLDKQVTLPTRPILDGMGEGLQDKTKEKNVKEMSVLTVESINSIFFQFLPVIKPYSHYMYWKIDQYNLMYNVAKLVKANAHYTLYGFLTIIEIIYSYPNKRLQPKQF